MTWSERKGGKKGTGGVYTKCSLHAVFRNAFKPSKMWTALETANPMITSSVLVCPRSPCRMNNWEALSHSRLMNVLSLSGGFSVTGRTLAPFYSSFCILKHSNIQSIIYLRDQDPQQALSLCFKILVELFLIHNLNSLTWRDMNSKGGCILPLISCHKHLLPLNCDFFPEDEGLFSKAL